MKIELTPKEFRLLLDLVYLTPPGERTAFRLMTIWKARYLP